MSQRDSAVRDIFKEDEESYLTVTEEDVVDDQGPEEKPVTQEEVPGYPRRKKSGTGKILLITAMVLLVGFAMIMAYAMLPQLLHKQQARRQFPGNPSPSSMAMVQLPGNRDLSQGHEVEPVPIDQMNSDFMAGLTPKPNNAGMADPLTGEAVSPESTAPQVGTAVADAPPTPENTPQSSEAGAEAVIADSPVANDPSTAEVLKRLSEIQVLLDQHSKQIDSLLASGPSETTPDTQVVGQPEAVEGQETPTATVAEQQAEASGEEQQVSAAAKPAVDEEQLLALKAQIADLEQEKAELMAKLQSTEKQAGQLRQDRSGLRKKVKALQKQVKKLEGANDWLRQLNNQKFSQIEQLKGQIVTMNKRPVLPGWNIIGMTDSQVVFSDDHRVVRLRVGDSFAGVKVTGIDIKQGMVDTNYGQIKAEAQ